MPLDKNYPFKVGEKFRIIEENRGYKVGTLITLCYLDLDSCCSWHQYKIDGTQDKDWVRSEYLEPLSQSAETIQLWPLNF
jgi:hypothetical protein